MKAFDTETVNRLGGGYACLLIKSGGETLEGFSSWREIFNFLAGEKFVCWNMDFDARAIMHEKFLPWRVLEKLALSNRASWGGFDFEYIPRKFFRAARGKKSFVLYDLAQFYGCSLDEASKKFLPAAGRKQSIPQSWYSEIDRCLSDRRREKILAYARRDADATLALYHLMRESLARIGLDFSRPVSPGALAMAKFRATLDKEPKIPRWVQECFASGFFGGRVEIYTMGKIGPCKKFDLHSAYPSAAAKLRSLRGLEFRRFGKDEWSYSPRARYGVYNVEAHILDMPIGPLAVRRKDGVIIFPVGIVKTVCGLAAIRLLRREKIRFRVFRALEFHGPETPLIFGEVPSLYKARENPELKLAVKLVLNSLYGKLAETRTKQREAEFWGEKFGNFRVTKREIWGRNANFILASAITEEIRLKIWETAKVLHSQGSEVYLSATDSLLTTGQIQTGPDLGEWGLEREYRGGVIYGSGRYVLFPTKTRKPEIHLRGFDSTPRNFAKIRDCKKPVARVNVFRTNSLTEWARGGCLGDFNVLSDFKRDFTISDDKRFWLGKIRRIRDASKFRVDSKPLILV